VLPGDFLAPKWSFITPNFEYEDKIPLLDHKSSFLERKFWVGAKV